MGSGDSRILVFIDASVWIAAAGSEQGGSSLVLEVCRGRRYAAQCSQRVLLEAQRNIRIKMSSDCLARFYRLLAAASPALVTPVGPEDEAAFRELAGAGDAHVIAAAVRGGAAFVVTLDRRHLANERLRGVGLPCKVVTPGEMLQVMRQSGGLRAQKGD
ncbi:MAG: PIN domain-containing protein [Anaerolineae bacterium]